MNCDCTQIVGSCEASIRVEPTGTAPSYGAKLRFTSTAPICSKISYFVDSTPYFNILSRGNTDEDSVFGTKPVTRDTITDVRCQVCKTLAAVTPQSSDGRNEAQARTAAVAGQWVDSQGADIQLTVSGNRLSGTLTQPGFRALPIESGTVDGERFEFTFRDYGGRRSVFRCTLTGPQQASCDYKADRAFIYPGTSATVTMTRK